MSAAAIGVRAAVVVLAAVGLALEPHAGAGTVIAVVLGAALAAFAPTRAGAFVLLAGLVVGWTLGYGSAGLPSALRTSAFAVLMYLTHAATALAASVPVDADLGGEVVARWARRCLPGVVAAVAAGVVLAILDTIARPDGSTVLDVVGLAAAVAVTAGLLRMGPYRR